MQERPTTALPAELPVLRVQATLESEPNTEFEYGTLPCIHPNRACMFHPGLMESI